MTPRKVSIANQEWFEKLLADGVIKKMPTPKPSKEPDPTKPADLFPDVLWIWEAYCFLSEQRGVGPNGPVPITANDMLAYSELTGRMEPRYRAQLIRFIPPMDRLFLRDFYDRQRIEMEKLQKKHATGK